MKSKANQCEYTKTGTQRCGGTKKQGGIYCPVHSQETYSESTCQNESCTRYVADPGTECYACHAADKTNLQNDPAEEIPDNKEASEQNQSADGGGREERQPSPATQDQHPTAPPPQSKLQTVHQKMAVEALKTAKQVDEEVELCGTMLEEVEEQLLNQTKNLARVVRSNRGSIARSKAQRQSMKKSTRESTSCLVMIFLICWERRSTLVPWRPDLTAAWYRPV